MLPIHWLKVITLQDKGHLMAPKGSIISCLKTNLRQEARYVNPWSFKNTWYCITILWFPINIIFVFLRQLSISDSTIKATFCPKAIKLLANYFFRLLLEGYIYLRPAFVILYQSRLDLMLHMWYYLSVEVAKKLKD